jgi:formylglycine-generating enzyme required for sulfatase activity
MTLIGSGPFRVSQSRSVWVPAFYIDVAPITNMQYARFLAATGHPPPPNWPDAGYAVADVPGVLHDDPVSALRWTDVCAYTMWSSKALPTAM